MAYLRPTGKIPENRSVNPSEIDRSQMYEIEKHVAKRFNSRYRDIDPRDVSRLIDALLNDLEQYEKTEKEYEKKIRDLEQKYEDLKAIKINSASPIIFPHQKLATRDSMLSQKFKYLEELLKKDELEIARLKDQNIKLQNMIFGSILEGEK